LKRKTFGFWQIKLLNLLVPLARPIDRFLPFPHLSWIVILHTDERTQGQESAEPAASQSLLSAQGNHPQDS